MLNFDQATLCECCECNPATHTPSSEEICTSVLSNCVLKYCNFDRMLRNEPSVDCIRKTQRNHLMLVEIKNQPTSNIDKENIEQKIKSTTQYLLDNESQLANLKRFFILAISEQKQPKKVNNKQSQNYIKIGSFLAHKRVSIFSNRIYRYIVGNQTYQIFSKVVLCPDTDEFCR